jgi:hypothetical protein
MRNLQARLADSLVPEYQNIQIQRPGSVADAGGTVAAEFLLDAKEFLEQVTSGEISVQSNDGVEKTGLAGEAYGLRGIEGRAADNATEGFKTVGRRGEGRIGVAGGTGKVGPHADVGGVHGFQIIARKGAVIGSASSGARD